jgi:hypothetical protein
MLRLDSGKVPFDYPRYIPGAGLLFNISGKYPRYGATFHNIPGTGLLLKQLSAADFRYIR